MSIARISEWEVEIDPAIGSQGVPGKRCKTNNSAKCDMFTIRKF
jgi:hypothetical protein